MIHGLEAHATRVRYGMTVSRRKFLQIAGIGTIGAATGYPALQFSRPALRRWLVEPDLPFGAAAGPLNDATLKVLQATTAALLEAPAETGHYRDFFQWRSQNVPGYKGLYEQFAARVNDAAGTSFADCTAVAQRGVLARCLRAGNVASHLGKVRVGLFERQWLVYDRYIVREIFDLFARTDAWVKLGYETWPGEHRGLYTYTQPPERIQNPNENSVGVQREESPP
jgi:hypothetical protein